MKIFHTILRIDLGLMLLAFGLNKFFWFLPDFKFDGFPEAEHLFEALRYSWEAPSGKGYVLGTVGLVEIMAGFLLVIKKWIPFAMVLLMPVSVHIVLFHAFVYFNPMNLGPALFVFAANCYLMYINWDAYKGMFK